jgi:hypothetical protein
MTPKESNDLYSAAKGVLANWDEFGPEAGLDERMDHLREIIRRIDAAWEQEHLKGRTA